MLELTMLVNSLSNGYPHESQGALRSLGPLVLPTGEAFAILRHHVYNHNGVVHGVVVLETIHRHVYNNIPPWQQHPESISGFGVEDHPVLPGSSEREDYFCDRLRIVPYPHVSV